MTFDRSLRLEAAMSRKSRLTLCVIIGAALAAIPGCSVGEQAVADARAGDARLKRSDGGRMTASDSLGGMVFGQPARRQGDTTFANAPTE